MILGNNYPLEQPLTVMRLEVTYYNAFFGYLADNKNVVVL